MAKPVTAIKFTAKLCHPAAGGDWTFLRLPKEASDQLNTRNMASVEGKLNGFGFAATLRPDSEGGHWLRVEPEWKEAAKARVGGTVELEISQVAVEPEPDVPEDLLKALSGAPAALAVWQDTTAIARRDWIEWMSQVKRVETRLLRIERMIDMLSKGKRRVCCFDRSGLASKAFVCPDAADESA